MPFTFKSRRAAFGKHGMEPQHEHRLSHQHLRIIESFKKLLGPTCEYMYSSLRLSLSLQSTEVLIA